MPLLYLRRFFKEYPYIFQCKILIGHCGPTLPPDVMIWTNLNLHYLRMLPHEFHLSWPSDSGEEDFLKMPLIFNKFMIISPWKRAWPFIWTNLNPLYSRMLCAKFGWNWPSGSWEEVENVKSLQQQRRRQRQRRQTTDKLWSEKLTWAFGSGELTRTYRYWENVMSDEHYRFLYKPVSDSKKERGAEHIWVTAVYRKISLMERKLNRLHTRVVP